ncbi:MAG: DUF4149 domain-containing protein [Bacteroidales bacterium]|nr:DUF4149 domain-containing protein [Clostridium sp.]MCM1203037.1 DUF4149 domain-containing protein [Bacteroidales bacterium]
MENEIKKFAARGRKKAWTVWLFFYIFSVLAVLLMYLISDGNIEKYKDFYIIYGILILVTVFLYSIMFLCAKITGKKQDKKFTREQLDRINREAAKAPRLEHILITQDAVGYHVGLRTVLVPVEDIIRISRVRQKHRHVYHSGSIFVPASSEEAYIYVYTRDGRVHRMENNLTESLELEIFFYLAYTVRGKRPGVWVDNPMEPPRTDMTTEELIRRADSGGTQDAGELEMRYNLEHIYEMCASDVGNSRWTETLLVFTIMATYIFSFFLFRAMPDFIFTENALQKDLFVRMGRTFGVGAVMAVPVILVVGSYLKNVLFDKERLKTQVLAAIYLLLGMISVGGFVGYCLFVQDSALGTVYGIEAWKDWRAWQSGKLESARGVLYMTDKPVDDGIQIHKENQYHYINGEDTCYSYYPNMMVNAKLMQEAYTVTYTPNLHILVSLKDAQGYERIGLTEEELPKLQKEFDLYMSKLAGERDIWEVGDCIIEKHPFVHGYEVLTEEEKIDFDFLYSEIMQEGVESTRTISMPESLEGNSFKKINALYECNRQFDSFRHYRYMLENEKIYVSQTIFSEDEMNEASEKYHAEAEKIIREMPEKLNDEEKIQWVTDYLLEHVKIFDYFAWLEENDYGEDQDSEKYKQADYADSGYGALVMGMASEQGYMEAFGMLLEKAGVYSIAVLPEEDSERSHCWNLVKPGKKWKAVNVYQMAEHPDEQETYNQISNDEMEKLLDTSGCYGGNEEISLP